MALHIQGGDVNASTLSGRPSTGGKKPREFQSLGPNTLITPLQDGTSRPSSSGSSYAGSRPSSSASNASASAPSDAIYNTQFTTAGRKFLTKVKKNRAMQVDRRTNGFQRGLDSGIMILDPITKKHFRVMIVDPDLQHREDLADALEQHFEIFVAATNDRAFALLAMFNIDFVLLRLALGNDQSFATSTGLEFLREIKKRYYYVPVSLLLRNAKQQDKLLAQALMLGGCGFFEDVTDVKTLIERMRKLLHSLVLATGELVKYKGRSVGISDDDERTMSSDAAQALTKRSNAAVGPRRMAAAKPPMLEYDKDKMLLELSLNQRRHCLARRKQLTETLATSHSVLGLGLSEERAGTDSPLSTLRSPSLLHCESSPSLATHLPSSPSLAMLRTNSIMKKIPPLPSQNDITKRIHTKPHEIQVKIHRHLYDKYHTATHEAIPHDPLLRPCVAVDPETVSKSASNLLVGKAYRLYLESRFEEAHQQCDRAIRVQDNNVVKLAYLLRGVLLDLSGHHAQAEREFLTSLKLDSSLHQSHFNLGVCRLKLGKDQQALQDITTALHFDPSNEDYLTNRALIYRRLGEFGLAQNEYSKIASLTKHTKTETLEGLQPQRSPIHTHTKSHTSNVDDDGMFDHLFGKPMPDKLALMQAPTKRDAAQLDLVVARLQSGLFFRDFPPEVLLEVARHLEYEVVACGEPFTLGEEHPHNFYVLLSGRLSVRRKLGDFASSVTTHHMDPGTPFGCAGHGINSYSKLIADESSEIGILWPDAYDATIYQYSTEKNNEIFAFLQQHKAFKLFTTSELGHIIGISERRRYRKGEILLEQNEIPQSLVILRKGTCLLFQDFERPPLSDVDEGDTPKRSADSDKQRMLPYHVLATPGWPLGFHVQHDLKTKKLKSVHGARRNALLDHKTAPSPADLLLHVAHHSMACEVPTTPLRQSSGVVLNNDEPRKTLRPGAIFGESALLEQHRTRAKCSVLTNSVVEVLLFDHVRLQEMELSLDVIDEIMKYAPEYIDEDQAIKQQIEADAWSEYKNLRVLELTKTRWPQAKTHLRVLANGCKNPLQRVATGQRPTRKPQTSMTEDSAANAKASVVDELTWLNTHECVPWGRHAATAQGRHLCDSSSYSVPIGLSGAKAALVNDHIAVVVGGHDHSVDHTYTSCIDLYDTRHDKWLTNFDVKGELLRRVGHSVVSIANRRVIVFGGEAIDNDRHCRNDCYDITFTQNVLYCTNALAVHTEYPVAPENCPCERAWHSACAITLGSCDGMLVLGGRDLSGKILGDLWALVLEDQKENAITDIKRVEFKWVLLTPSGSGPLPLAYHSAVSVDNGTKVVVLGGRQSPRGAMSDGVHILDIATNTWSQVAMSASSPVGWTTRSGLTALEVCVPLDESTGRLARIPATSSPEKQDASENLSENSPPMSAHRILIVGGFSERTPVSDPTRFALLDTATGIIREIFAPSIGLITYLGQASLVAADAKSVYFFGGIDAHTRQFVATTNALRFWEPQFQGDDTDAQDSTTNPNAIRTKAYDNGDEYTGEMDPQGLQRQGQGRCVYLNGGSYEGEWHDDVRSGQGVMTYANGDTYAGQWEADQRHGFGILEIHSTSDKTRTETRYDGQWRHDRRAGKGTLQFSDGSKLEGDWQDGDMVAARCRLENYDDGNGICTYNGEVLGGLPHGQGESQHTHEMYIGEWLYGKRSGHGVVTLLDGTTYTGDWKNGKRNGFGVCMYARTRDQYDGKWVGGVRCGRGVCRYANGAQYDGEWLADQCHGVGKYTFADSTFYEGHWKHNKFCGDGAFVLDQDTPPPPRE